MAHLFIDQSKYPCEKCGTWVYVNTAQGPDDTTYEVKDHPGSCLEELEKSRLPAEPAP
jgi:hypothetical protein